MDIKLPKLGEGADSGTVVNVLVQEGDQVEDGQTIVELENEKAVAPIPATASGVVSRIKVKEGDRLSVGQVIMTISTDGDGGGEEGGQKDEEEPKKKKKSRKSESKKQQTDEDEAEAEPKEKEETEGEEPDSHEEESEEEDEEGESGGLPPAAPPSIRRMARQLGIDLRRVRGTEAGGRISMSDMKAYVQRLQKLAFASKRGEGAASGGTAQKAKTASIDFSQWGPVTRKSMSPLRQTISRRMAENWNTVPHVTQFDEADITELNALRKKFAESYDEKGAKLTLTPFVLKAVAAALQKHPIFNASLDEAAGEIVYKEYYHLGLAVDTEHGLMVPVIRDVDKKSLLELSKEVNAMAEKARERKISLEEMKGGTFTISNQGGIGGAHFTPIVNKPEVAILGLGRGALKPVVRGGNIEQRLLMPLGLSYDHRVIDGGSAARFTVDLLEAFQAFKEEEVKI